MSTVDYTAEELNFFRVYSLIASTLPSGLRIVFQREWDSRYQKSLGKWEGTAQNLNDFCAMESRPGIQLQLLELVKSGDWKNTDCTFLFKAILYSNSIGRAGLSPTIESTVNDLREFRNYVIHDAGGRLEEKDYKLTLQKLLKAFSSLKLDKTAIEEKKNQKGFTTEEVCSLKKKLDEERKNKRILEENLTAEKEKSSALEEELLKAEAQSFCVLPPKPSHETFNRQGEVLELIEKMNGMMEENKNQVTTVYLSGNPGCGKSQMARQIAEHLYNSTAHASRFSDLTAVMTLDAENEEKLLRSYTEFASKLGCTQYFIGSILKSEESKPGEKIGHLKSMIASKLKHYSSWLLIVDNATSLNNYCQHWPRSGETDWGYGQILITTQDSKSILSDSLSFHVPLSEGMQIDDAITTLETISGFSSEREIEMEVANLLDRQPLALACAAVYVRRVREAGQPFTWENYKQKLQEGKRESTENIYMQVNHSYSKGMYTAVRLAIEEEVHNCEEMKIAFQYLSLLAPDPLPLSYFIRYIEKFKPHEDHDYLAARITTSSLLLFSGIESNSIRTHQVVHECLVSSIFSRYEAPGIDAVTAAILTFTELQSFDQSNIADIRESQFMVSHISKLTERIYTHYKSNSERLLAKWSTETEELTKLLSILDNMGNVCLYNLSFQNAKKINEIILYLKKSVLGPNNPEVAHTLIELGSISNSQDHYEEAQRYFESALTINEPVLGPNHPVVAGTLNGLGIAASHQGHYGEANRYFERALTISETVFGPNHPEVAKILDSLGNTASDQGQYEKAQKYFERALTINESAFGPNHLVLAKNLHNLGNVANDKGQHEEAKFYNKRALMIKESVYGPNHPILGNTINSLGITAHNQGQYEEAKRYFERARMMNESAYGLNHPYVVALLSNLGKTSYEQGQYEEAEKYYERALTINESLFGPDHADVAGSLYNVGNTVLKQGHYEEAKKYYERALTITETVFDPNHAQVAPILNNLGNTAYKQGQYEKAKKYFERALTIEISVFGQNHVDVADTLSNLGKTAYRLGQYEEVKKYFERALTIRETVFDPNHSDIADTLSNLGHTANELGQYEEAMKYFERALTINESGSRPSISIVLTLLYLGKVANKRGQNEEAKKYFERALTIKESVFGPEYKEAATTFNSLGITAHNQGQYEEAKRYFERALTINESVFGPIHPHVVAPLGNIGKTAYKQGQYKEAKKYYERALTINESLFGPNHAVVAGSLYNLGNAAHKEVQYEEAKKYFERALTIYESVFGPNNPHLVATLNNLGITLHNQGQYEESKKYFERARAINKSVVCPNHPDYH